MKKTIILASVVAFILTGCSGENKAKQANMMPPMMVKTLTAKSESVPLNFTYPARIVSEEDVDVRARISGVVLQKHFQAGKNVKKGDLLFTIDPDVYKARYDVQVANVNVAKANLSQADKEFKRVKALYEKKATSQKNYDSASAAYEIAKANVAQAVAMKDSAKIDYAYTKVVAPFDGVVGDALINTGDFVPPNTPLVRVTKQNPLFAEFYIPDVENFNIEQKIEDGIWSKINSDASIYYAKKELQGKIYFIDKVINAKSGTVKAKVIVENNDNILPVGSFATVNIKGFNQKQGFKIPTIALQQDLANTFLYIVSDLSNEDAKTNAAMSDMMKASGVVKMLPVKIDYQEEDFVLISGALKDGDKIIMNNFKKINIGSKVKIVGTYDAKDAKSAEGK